MQLLCWDMAFLGWVASPFGCFLLWTKFLWMFFGVFFCFGFLIKQRLGLVSAGEGTLWGVLSLVGGAG
jgi:hypothetical protein